MSVDSSYEVEASKEKRQKYPLVYYLYCLWLLTYSVRARMNTQESNLKNLVLVEL